MRATCQCGRQHFATANEDKWDESELYHLREMAATNKNAVFEHENVGYIMIGEIGTMVYVEECDCRQLMEIEKFLWVARNEILDYYYKKQKLIEANLRQYKKRLSPISPIMLNREIPKNDKGNGKD